METSNIQLDIKTFLSNAIIFAIKNNYSFSCWKNPLENKYQISICFNNPTIGKIEVENSKAGFCFAPFDNTDLNQTLFFESNILYTIDENILTPIIGSELFESFCQDTHPESADFYFSSDKVENTLKDNYLQAVVSAKKEIKDTSLQKVIVSKVKTSPINKKLNLAGYFTSITEQYPNAFISLITSPSTGTWIGASPEILVSHDKNNVFKTVALAGTQKSNISQSLKEAVWSQKEIEEQALVSRYIIECLKKIRLREYDDFGPRTVKAGNLLHLKTEFFVDLKQVQFPNLSSVMLELLHPTSAVCGMPKTNALNFIHTHENHDRKFYSGFLGPVNIEQETQLYVNLRCVQVLKDKLVFYAGAGITEDSDPDKEWEETEQKCAILGSVFN